MNKESTLILRLLSGKNIGTKKAYNLIQQLKQKGISLADFIAEIDNGNNTNIVPANIAESIRDTKEKVAEYIEKLKRNNVKAVNRYETHYPKKLTETLKEDAPLLLFYKGNYELITQKSIGFCGSREVTEKGLSTVESIVNYIKDNAVYTSGYAKGVDLKVHESSLKNGYSTIIVLPEGILNLKIKSQISHLVNDNNTLFISEFLPDSAWSVGNAMQRNSTIIALSDAMILIEAKDHGGSYSAGLKALELNVPLYTPKYGERNEQNLGNFLLAKQGATTFGINNKTKEPVLDKLLSYDTRERLKFNFIEQKTLFNYA